MASTGSSTGPSVSAVIPVRDDATELQVCLGLLAAQAHPVHEVVVVDNASSDGSAEVASAFGARVVTEPRVGIPFAAAAGYDAATGDVVARLDADSRPGAGWVARIARHFEDDTLDAVTGAGLFHDLPWLVRVPVSAAYLGAYYLPTSTALAQVPLWGSSMAVRRSTWMAVSDRVHRDADVHDDMDLAFALGPTPGSPGARIRFDPLLRADVSRRSLKGGDALHRRFSRARTTLRLNWDVAPPWERWQERLSPGSSD